ncbi:alginate lyase family protein [candidate division KSB1 bacterium]|nr:alginate lyase family protein [candidate division KSB1 bacterium]
MKTLALYIYLPLIFLIPCMFVDAFPADANRTAAAPFGELSMEEHPHLIVKGPDIDGIANRIRNGVEPWFSQYQWLLAEADTIPDQPDLWDDNLLILGDWTEYKSKADSGQRRIASLMLACLYSRDAAYGDKLKNHMLGWCDLYKLMLVDNHYLYWSHAHPLASLVIIIAIAYDLTYNKALFSSEEKAQVTDWLSAAVPVIKERHERNDYWSNQKVWENAALMLSGLVLKDSVLISYVLDDTSHVLNTKYLMKKMIMENGQICDRWLDCYDLWHSLLALNAFALIASAATENNLENLWITEPALTKSLEYYAPVFQSNDINDLGPGYVMADSTQPDHLYFSGIYEIAHKYLPQNTTVNAVLSDPDFNVDSGRLCRNYRRQDKCTYCSRWIKYPLLLWGQELYRSKVVARVFLQGFYTGNGAMHDSLLQKNLIPHETPYDGIACSVTTIPQSVVDWISMEFLHQDGACALKTSAFLRQDGYIADIDGSVGFFVDIEPDYYTLRIGHRNHVTVKSSQPIFITSLDVARWDFTVAVGQSMPAHAAVLLQPDLWASRCGDLNEDAIINSEDYVLWYNSTYENLSGYVKMDLNGDGRVNYEDFDLWFAGAAFAPASVANF